MGQPLSPLCRMGCPPSVPLRGDPKIPRMGQAPARSHETEAQMTRIERTILYLLIAGAWVVWYWK